MTFLTTAISSIKKIVPRTNLRTLKTDECDSQLYTSCTCYNDTEGHEGTFFSFYTNWSLILLCFVFVLTIGTVITQKYIQKSFFNYLLAPLILASVANSFTVFFLSQFLYFNLSVSSSQEVKLDTDLVNALLFSNFLLHQLPMIGSLLILFLFQFIKLKSYRGSTFLIGFAIIALFTLVYLLVPEETEDKTVIVGEKVDLIYGVNVTFMLGLFITFIVVYGSIVYTICR